MSDLTPTQIEKINQQIAAGKYRYEEPKPEKPAARKTAAKKPAEDRPDD